MGGECLPVLEKKKNRWLCFRRLEFRLTNEGVEDWISTWGGVCEIRGKKRAGLRGGNKSNLGAGNGLDSRGVG